MKRIGNYAAVTLIAALMSGIPATAGQYREDVNKRGGMQYESVDHHRDGERNNKQNREFRNDDRGNRDRQERDRSTYGRGYRGGYGYATPVYESAPVYGGPVYDGYYGRRDHTGRTAAIIGGSAAAGALIGAATGHGQGAVIGAVIGGIAGVAVSAAADHRR